ncbi:phospholipase [Bifidobacterium primatium]|uniref:Phospholipase n=3 Tax=Bifidobacterium TaxID=1678 RepID=A0A2M9HBU7_9BIFI|nr:alpha/beta fold hydrolase [Bifidobacterium sp. SMB2]NEH10550.1 alpha/beta fold hydrolase [Bifidobacterium saimiriisciurei]NEH10667.1 alpha/beta fold hydrolase [Bifidobacterium saimiriisciurei]PJM74285.1 phospholipase [Bifidobacterium primatium]
MISNIDFDHDDDDDLFVMFHGYGNDEQEMVRIIDAIEPDADYISVQAPIHRTYLGGHAWYDSAGWDNARIQAQCSAIGDRLVTLLDASGLLGRRIVLVGFSQGGYLSYRLLADHPDVFDAAVLLAPSFHDDVVTVPDLADDARPDVFLGYGTLDRQIPDGQKAAMREALARFTHGEEHSYDGMRHDVCEREFADIRAFLSR